LSNSGTEAVEAALKHCLLAYGKKQQERLQDLQKGMNEAHLYVQELDENQLAALTQDWRYRLINMCSDIKASDKRKDWLLHMALQTHDMMGLIDLVHEFNKHQLSEIPLTVSLERAYHGKTMGALNLTHNPKYRYPFYVSEGQNRFLPPHADDVQLEKFFGELKFDIIEIGLHQIGLFFGKTTFTRVAGLFVEPIQGEAGV
ncbi:MAG: aminotransferase class III-fold pyridoxal phosphate-dependent enzyme, partial [bacterium]